MSLHNGQMIGLDLNQENDALDKEIAEIMDKTEVVVNGNCVVCEKQLNCGRLLVCKECQGLLNGDDFHGLSMVALQDRYETQGGCVP